MRSADVRLVIGTRPEAIKLAPVATALAARGLTPRLIFTGQHPYLDPCEYGLEQFVSVDLGCPGLSDPHRHVQAVTTVILPRLRPRPELMVVQGDTSSALGGSLAAFKACIPVAHVEAGLRTHDPRQPWPEEEYRVAIDAGAQLLFAPTELSAHNLRMESVAGEIHITGNTSIDAALAAEARLPASEPGKNPARHVLVTCHRRESWGEGLREIASALIELGSLGRGPINGEAQYLH